jgi:uncharacterized protein YndB with AHSA1/START domain
MTKTEKTLIAIEATVNAPVEKVWSFWNDPRHIVKWNHASDDWHSPRAENDLKVGGKFLVRMEAKDGSFGFDFAGEYTKVDIHKEIEYVIADGRKVHVSFDANGKETTILETFEAERENSEEMQQQGWQAILDSFKKYVENASDTEKLKFEISINARVEKVYKTMLEKTSYEAWTSIFNPSSSYEGSWEKGSKILFIGTNSKGEKEGMVSKIKDNITNKFVSIEHLGMIQNGKEIMTGPEVEAWAGALENYSFESAGDKTLLSVEMDANEAFKSYFMDTWPKALDKLKSICEGSSH